MHTGSMFVFALAILVPFQKDGKWGYREKGGSVAIPPRYQMAREFSAQGIAAVVDEQGWAWIDHTGQVLVRPLVIDNGPDYFREGVARFRRDGKVGFFDRHGKIVIKPGYEFAMPFFEGRAAVCDGCAEVEEGEHRAVRGGKWGYIDAGGKLVVPLQFVEAGNFVKGHARVRSASGWQEIGVDGQPARRR